MNFSTVGRVTESSPYSLTSCIPQWRHLYISIIGGIEMRPHAVFEPIEYAHITPTPWRWRQRQSPKQSVLTASSRWYFLLRKCLVWVPAGASKIETDVAHGFTQPLPTNWRIVLLLGHDHFLPKPFQLMNHPTVEVVQCSQKWRRKTALKAGRPRGIHCRESPREIVYSWMYLNVISFLKTIKSNGDVLLLHLAHWGDQIAELLRSKLCRPHRVEGKTCRKQAFYVLFRISC